MMVLYGVFSQVDFSLQKSIGPILDVDWKNTFQFASSGVGTEADFFLILCLVFISSSDKMIYVCELAKDKPIRTMSGHTDHVNALKWDPSR
jgi:transducin (beta)-like 1